MKKKKLLSALLASALMVTAIPFQAFAAPVKATPSDALNGEISGSSTVASSALVRAIIPADFDFVVNPLELTVTGSGASAGSNDQIISTPYTFINKSNMGLQLTVTPKFTSTNGITVASSPDEIKNVAGEAPIIFLQVAPITAKPALTGAGSTLQYDTASTPTFASGDGLSVTVGKETTNPVYFKLHDAKSAYTTDGTDMFYDDDEVTSTVADAASFRFTGKVSQMAAWTDKAPGVTVEYKFDFITDDVYNDNNNDVAGTYNMVDTNLAVTTPVYNLASNGVMSFANVPEGYKPSGLFYLFDKTTTLSITQSDIEAAAADVQELTGLEIDGHKVGKMTGLLYTWPDLTKPGALSAQGKKNVSGGYLIVFTKFTKEGEESLFAVSPCVHMDVIPEA